MAMLIGIDTGGTFTDAVCIDDHHGVFKAAKSATTRDNLAIGIRKALKSVLPKFVKKVRLVSLSTTLATNAIVEGHGCPSCLLLIGYKTEFLNLPEFNKIRSGMSTVFLQGGHTLEGAAQAPLDINQLKDAIIKHASSASAFGISGYFGVRNPSHELAVKKLVTDLTGLPVTCGHELTTDLNAPLRALTVALNMRLIPLIQNFIAAVQEVMVQFDIHAPLMIVKGDGSLINADMAIARPVETILSGPAASVIGAKYLANQDDAFVVDMGGTTTDIAMVQGGTPALNEKGSRVSGFRTMIKAVDVHTRGIGGDSEISVDNQGDIAVGPKRAVPLCVLGERFPKIVEVLKKRLEINRLNSCVGNERFFIRLKANGVEKSKLTAKEQEVLKLIKDEPVHESFLIQIEKYRLFISNCIDCLVEKGLIIVSTFTPTDAVNVLGFYQTGSHEASFLGGTLLAEKSGMHTKRFCERIQSMVNYKLASALINHALYDEKGIKQFQKGSRDAYLIHKALTGDEENNFSVSISMNRPLVAIGAPVGVYFPAVASILNARLLIPEHAEVASAVGAVAGSIMQTVSILIKPLNTGEGHRVHLPDSIKDFTNYTDAENYAKQIAETAAVRQANRAGAETVKVNLSINCKKIDQENEDGSFYIDSKIVATATGRPSLGGSLPEI